MAPSPPPLFLLSAERSGSTLLRYILDTHPDICCPGELFLGQLALALHTTLSRTTALLEQGGGEARESFTRTEARRLILGPVEAYTRARGKRFWCDKTPANLEHLGEIEATFPGARYICLHRACLDVVHSCLESRRSRGTQDAYTPFEGTHPELIVSFMLEKWVQAAERMLAFEASHPDRCHRIRYEDLLADPPRALEPLFKFIGVPWEPSLLGKVFTAPHDIGTGDEKILSTDRILKDNAGKGRAIDPALLAKLPRGLLERRKKAEQALGY